MTENGLMESSQTEKLFYNNSHQKSFEATVLSCQKKENYYEIVLDQTAFFPEGGGQYADTGYLGDAKVLDVQEQEGQILHRTDQELPVGEKVTGQLDWELRFMKMQQQVSISSPESCMNAMVMKMLVFIWEMKTVRWILAERSRWKICRK